MADIRDVARQAGVSISTVSRVMNGSKAVSDELRTKVEQAITDLSYRANSVAQGLKVSKTNKIAMIITAVSRTFFTTVIEGASEEAERLGYSLLIAETHDKLDREMEIVESFVSQWVDGIILASSAYGHDAKTLQYVQRLEALEKKGNRIPVITLEYALDSPSIDAVVVDYEKSACDATKYLLKLGRRKIAHISLPKNHRIGSMRIAGFKRAHEEFGVPYDATHILEGDYTTYSGYRVTRQLLLERHDIDAIFCANDQMAVGAIKACEEQRVSVPGKIAIVGNDDIFPASIVSPSLTSINVPKYEIGAVAVRRMHELLEQGNARNARQIITLSTNLEERESTNKNAQWNLRLLDW